MGKEDIGKKLYKAALKKFQEIGYFNTDIRSICGEAGVSLGSFYNYYKDKRALYIKIFKDEYISHTQSLLKDISAIENGITNYTEYIETIIKNHLKNHKHTLLFYVETESIVLQDKELFSIKRELETEAIGKFMGILSKQVSKTVNLQYGLPLVFTLVEKTIQFIFEEPEEVQNIIIKELCNMIRGYLFSNKRLAL